VLAVTCASGHAFHTTVLSALFYSQAQTACLHANSSAITFAQYVMAVTAAPCWFWQKSLTIKLGREIAMKKIALILALVFPLTIGVALSSAFAFRLLPLSTDPCYIAKEGTPHFVAIPRSDGLARLPVLVR
jgi:hypothetical protein